MYISDHEAHFSSPQIYRIAKLLRAGIFTQKSSSDNIAIGLILNSKHNGHQLRTRSRCTAHVYVLSWVRRFALANSMELQLIWLNLE